MKAERRDPAALIAAVLSDEPPHGPVLFAGEDAADAKRRSGNEGTVWVREAGGPAEPMVWPPDGDYAAATLRLPRAHDAYVMALHALAARLPEGAPLYVYGPNDEGIRSAPRDFTPFFDAHESVLMRGHARVWRAKRSASSEGLKASLADWRRVQPLEFGGVKRDWVSYPGVFAHGLLDPATALLIEALPQNGSGPTLDFGAGSGILARALSERGFEVDMIERDAIVLEAARENAPAARAILDDGFNRAGDYGLIVSNPPIHVGRSLNLGLLERLVTQAPRHLKRGGALLVVAQQTVPVPRFAEGQFEACEQLAETRGFRVWRLKNP